MEIFIDCILISYFKLLPLWAIPTMLNVPSHEWAASDEESIKIKI